MLSFIFVIVCGLFVCKQICSEFLFVYICIVGGDSVIRRGIPLTSLTSPHCCACPKSGPEFPMPYVMVLFMFNDLWLEAIVYYVDIDGIVDHHCLSFYFIIQVKIMA